MAIPHQQLDAWQQAMQLVKTVYPVTQTFPKEELLGLVSQMRRAAVSVPRNVAKGSQSELETQLLISADLGYLNPQHEVFQLLERVARLVTGFHRKAVGAISKNG